MRLGVIGIAAGNVASKGAGLIREVLFAAWFGTGETAAAFRVAQAGYLLPSQGMLGESLGAGLLPLYRRMGSENVENQRILVLVATMFTLAFSAILTTLLFVFSREVVGFVAPGASAEALELAARLLRIMALVTPFLALGGALAYLETASGHYGSIAWRPLLLNVAAIAGAGFAVWLGADYWLAIGVVAGYLLFFGLTLWNLRKIGGIWPHTLPALTRMRAVFGRFLRNFLPLLALPVAAQAMLLVERIVSSWIGTAVIPSIDYARFICDTVVQMIALPLSILTMSTRGGNAAEGMHEHICQVTRLIMLIAFPIGVFVGLNAEGIVQTLYGRGAFGDESVQLTAAITRGMGAAIGIAAVSYYLIKTLNAQLRNREALFFIIIAGLTASSVNLLFWQTLGVEVIGIAFACYSAILLIAGLGALNLWSAFVRFVPWVAGGLLVQTGCNLAILNLLGEKGIVGLALNVLITGTLWLSGILLIPALRHAAWPLLSRSPLPSRILDRFRR